MSVHSFHISHSGGRADAGGRRACSGVGFRAKTLSRPYSSLPSSRPGMDAALSFMCASRFWICARWCHCHGRDHFGCALPDQALAIACCAGLQADSRVTSCISRKHVRHGRTCAFRRSSLGCARAGDRMTSENSAMTADVSSRAQPKPIETASPPAPPCAGTLSPSVAMRSCLGDAILLGPSCCCCRY